MLFRAAASGRFTGAGLDVRCALGSAGVIEAARKREGDGYSPAGIWPLQRVLFRAHRIPAPQTKLPIAPLAQDDGWCDAPGNENYNRFVKLPCPAGAERLWRNDELYDVIVILGFNDNPVVPGAGSAIFWHIAHTDYTPTQGCVAIARADMLTALAEAAPGDTLEIVL